MAGIRYQASYTETESLDFPPAASVKTADIGNWNSVWKFRWNAVFVPDQPADPDWQRPATEKDPLVLNVNAPAAHRSKSDFDVDKDGKADKVSMLQPAAVSALDKNSDGKPTTAASCLARRAVGLIWPSLTTTAIVD